MLGSATFSLQFDIDKYREKYVHYLDNKNKGDITKHNPYKKEYNRLLQIYINAMRDSNDYDEQQRSFN